MIILFCLFALLFQTNSGEADYTDFTTWKGACAYGKRQSPINIISGLLEPCSYEKTEVRFWDGKSIIQTHTPALKTSFSGSTLNIIDHKGQLLFYQALQFHWHYPSEHLIDGKAYDLQLHFVHTLNPSLASKNNISVLGMLFQVDYEAETDIIDMMQLNFQDINSINIANLNQVLSSYVKNKNFFTYEGSLTTPGCDEIVYWNVLQQIIPIKPQNFAKMVERINHLKPNARPAQAMNGRKVKFVHADCNDRKIDKLTLLYKNMFQNRLFWQFMLITLIFAVLCIY